MHTHEHIAGEIRVVQVLYSLSIGGSEILGRDISVQLHDRGFSCAVCALEFGGAIEEDLKLRSIPYFTALRKPGEYLSVMLRIFRFFKKNRPDIVHTHHLYELVYSALGAKLVGAKIIHTEHSHLSLRSNKARYLLKAFSLLCEKISTVDEETTMYLRDTVGIPSNKLITLPNGVDLSKYSPSTLPSPEVKGILKSRRAIGIVARLEKVKDHLTLLRAFSEIHAADEQTMLLIIGDGSERNSIEEECSKLGIAPHVRFIGMRRDIPEILAAIDVFVLSSVSEGLPISLLEAMAMAKPIVATSVGSIPNVIVDNHNGMLVKPGDHEAFARRIPTLLHDKDLAEAMGSEARRHIEENYDLKVVIQRYRKLYGKIMAGSNKSSL